MSGYRSMYIAPTIQQWLDTWASCKLVGKLWVKKYWRDLTNMVGTSAYLFTPTQLWTHCLLRSKEIASANSLELWRRPRIGRYTNRNNMWYKIWKNGSTFRIKPKNLKRYIISTGDSHTNKVIPSSRPWNLGSNDGQSATRISTGFPTKFLAISPGKKNLHRTILISCQHCQLVLQ